MSLSNLLIFYLVVTFIPKTFDLQCGDENIDHCEECGIGEAISTCAKCEENFLLHVSSFFYKSNEADK